MTFETISYLDENGRLAPTCQHAIPNEDLIKGYQKMVLTRLVDDRMVTLQRQGTISFALSSLGEEACSVASAAALQPEDWMYPQYRECGIMFWRDFSIQDYLHHMFGNEKDLILGRQMPNHFGSRKINVVTVSSPIGTQLPHAAGAAYAMKLQNEKAVSMCYFGEGTTSEGDFHVGLNFAAVRKAPVIFFCRNNGYAISTPCCRQFASEGIAPKGVGYGMKTYRVDGNDYFAIHETVANARQYCLDGHGPVLIEAMTYRLGAHSTSDDPSLYRSSEEVAAWEKKCPILRLRRYLEQKGLWDESKEKAYADSVVQSISEAIAVAKTTPKPTIDSIVEGVYFEVPPTLKQQLNSIKPFFAPVHEEVQL